MKYLVIPNGFKYNQRLKNTLILETQLNVPCTNFPYSVKL